MDLDLWQCILMSLTDAPVISLADAECKLTYIYIGGTVIQC